MLLTTRVLKENLQILSTGKVAHRFKSLVELLEAYLTDVNVNAHKYPFHLYYLTRVDNVGNDRLINKYKLDLAPFNMQVSICAELLDLTKGLEVLHLAAVVEVLNVMSRIALHCNTEDLSMEERYSIIKSMNNTLLLHPTDSLEFVCTCYNLLNEF